MNLEGRVALITGAGRGIGLGIAERLCAAGATVVIGELIPERGAEAAERLASLGYRAASHALDVTRSADCAAIVEFARATYGRLDILVNNAGLFILKPSAEMPEADWRVQVDVMLNGVFFMSQAAATAMMRQEHGGAMVNIASIGGMGGWPMRSAYNAAKAGVITLTQVLATEWAQHNIRVNAVSPGVTRTEMMDVAIKQGVASLDRYSRRTPMGRVAEVGEVADAVCFLASDRASYITGVNLRVDGGWVPWGNLAAAGFPEEG